MHNMHSKIILVSKKYILFEDDKKILNFNKYILGPFLKKEIVPDVVNIRSKQKKLYIDALETTLKNMLPSTSYYKMNINTKMGFLLGIYKNSNLYSLKNNILYLNNIITDAELCVDLNFNFIPVDDVNQDNNFIK